MIRYETGKAISVEAFVDVLGRCSLGPRRPLDDRACMEGMIAHADLVVTAWDDELLVGVARSVTDFTFCCYLSDLAVDETYQKQGIGRALIDHTRSKLGPRCCLILLAAPAAADYYERIGFSHHPRAWTINPDVPLR